MVENIINKVWWDEKEKVLRTKICGDQDGETAKKLLKEMAEAGEKIPGKLLVLNDMTQAGKPTIEARKQLISGTRPDKIKKIAFFGGNILTRIIISFIMASSGINKAKTFKTKEKALKWLKK
jgi:UDP-N-acetylmuramyl pentapeptide synthase